MIETRLGLLGIVAKDESRTVRCGFWSANLGMDRAVATHNKNWFQFAQ